MITMDFALDNMYVTFLRYLKQNNIELQIKQ